MQLKSFERLFHLVFNKPFSHEAVANRDDFSTRFDLHSGFLLAINASASSIIDAGAHNYGHSS